MRVPGHELGCQCQHCLDGNIYMRTPSGRIVNHTRHIRGGPPYEDNIQATPKTELCQEALEYRRGKPVIPKGKRRR